LHVLENLENKISFTQPFSFFSSISNNNLIIQSLLMKTFSVNPYFIGLSVLIVSLSACHKEKEDPTKITTTNIAGTYKATAMTYQDLGGNAENIYPYLDECEKNALHTFNKDMTYTRVDTCSPPTNYSGPWILTSSNEIVIVEDTSKIISFDGHNLALSQKDSDGEVHITLTKQ
jgi:hypothetical protein